LGKELGYRTPRRSVIMGLINATLEAVPKCVGREGAKRTGNKATPLLIMSTRNKASRDTTEENAKSDS